MERFQLWHSELVRVWVQYMAAGFAAIPAGVLYAVLLQHSVPQKHAFLPSICLGVGFGLTAWIGVGRRLRKATSVDVNVEVTVVVGEAWVSWDVQINRTNTRPPLFTNSLETNATGTNTLVAATTI